VEPITLGKKKTSLERKRKVPPSLRKDIVVLWGKTGLEGLLPQVRKRLGMGKRTKRHVWKRLQPSLAGERDKEVSYHDQKRPSGRGGGRTHRVIGGL